MNSQNTTDHPLPYKGIQNRTDDSLLLEQFISSERAVATDPFIGTRTKQLLEERFTKDKQRTVPLFFKQVQVILGTMLLLLGLVAGIYLGYRSTENHPSLAQEEINSELSHELFISQIQNEEHVPFVEP